MTITVSVDGNTDYVLVASGCNGAGAHAGLATFDGHSIERVDNLDSTGLCTAGGRVIRILQPPNLASATDVLIYDADGIAGGWHLDSVFDPHDVAWDGENVIIVSTGDNSVAWIGPAGELIERWVAPGEGDSWHLNCLLIKEREVFLSAFGRFDAHRQWAGMMTQSTGIVFSLTTGETMIANLTQPHSPRYVDDGWVVCNSAECGLLQFNSTGDLLKQSTRLEGYTRGVAVSDDFLFVGESLSRNARSFGDSASIAVVSRSTWKVVDRIPLPCNEIYDLLLVERPLAEGMHRSAKSV